MKLRKIIREQISTILNEAEHSSTEDIFAGIGQQIANDIENINKIITTQNQDMKNADNEYKANYQLKSKLNADNPQKAGLERELPVKQKDIVKRKQQLKDLQDAQKGLQQAQDELDKKQKELDQMKAQKNGEEAPESSLPSHESPI